MEKKSLHNPKSNLEDLVAKAKSVGFDSVPDSASELETKVVEIFRQSGKILTAKQVQAILPEKETKWFSDKLWYLAKKGVLRKLPTRGYYQYPQEEKSS